jgi:hypothetical protein
MHSQVPQRIHDLCNIDVVGTSNTACVTGCTNPDRLRTEDPFPVAILDMAEDLIGKKVHGIGNRAPGRALLTLVTGLERFTAGLDNFRQKGILRLLNHPFA